MKTFPSKKKLKAVRTEPVQVPKKKKGVKWFLGFGVIMCLIIIIAASLPDDGKSYAGLPSYEHVVSDIDVDEPGTEYESLPIVEVERRNDTRGEYYEDKGYEYLGWFTKDQAKNIAKNYDDARYYEYYDQWRVWIK